VVKEVLQTPRSVQTAPSPQSGANTKDLARKPQLARAEIMDKATRERFEEELDGALKRRPVYEAKLAGALRAVAPLSPHLRGAMGEMLAVMLRRGSYTRELYMGSMRALAESDEKHSRALLKTALSSDEAGGSAALSAACFSKDPSMGPVLAKLAASRQSHLAFSAETARVARSESNGAHLAALAPMIKESHRISLCVELFVPLARAAPVSRSIAPALNVLRGAERHLGRWLVLAEVATKAGDTGPSEEASAKANQGPTSARAAWSLVSWALSETTAKSAASRHGATVETPQTRPTVELVARLSDRPSADRDTTFLFRMARARAAVAKPMLEGLVKFPPLADDVSVRAALYLARDHGRDDLRDALVETATASKKEELRGLAAAAMWDIGQTQGQQQLRDRAREIADDLLTSKVIGNVAWGALIRAAANKPALFADAPIIAETPFRWIQWGWLE
jgi:hypothetical protein